MTVDTTDKTTGEVVELRTAYNYDRNKVSDETGLDCTGDPGFTQQQFAEESDINTIVRRFGLTGEMPSNPSIPVSGDFTSVTDYQTALNSVIAADEAFMALPANIRAEFQNDPQQLMDFVEDGRNRDRAIAIGLIPAPAPPPSPPQEPGKP